MLQKRFTILVQFAIMDKIIGMLGILKMGFLMNAIKNMDKKALIETAKKSAQASNKWWVFILLDIVWCGLKYGTGYVEYWVFKFYKIPRKLRKTYYSRVNNNKLVRALNNPAYNQYFDSKILFNQTFSKFIHRECLPVSELDFETFQSFCQRHDYFVAKPDKDTCGKGVEKYVTAEIDNLQSVYEHIKSGDFGLIEEGIHQHPAINEIYPGSVNTIRFLMIKKDGVNHIIFVAIRMGHNGMCVDNFDNGGMSAQINEKTGEIYTVAVDGENKTYTHHPYTGAQITGRFIPKFDECLKMVDEACNVVPQIRYVGWDVTVTEDGPQLIEGNRYPGCLLYPEFNEQQIGYLPIIKGILGDEWKNVGINTL